MKGRLVSVQDSGPILVFLFIYILMVLGTFLSEVTYRKRPFKDVMNDSKRILIRCLLYLGIMVVSTFVYYLLGVG